LIAGGKCEDTPVALIRWGTFPQQEMLRATLKTLSAKMDEVGFHPPALLVIGEVVKFTDQLKPIIQSAEYAE